MFRFLFRLSIVCMRWELLTADCSQVWRRKYRFVQAISPLSLMQRDHIQLRLFHCKRPKLGFESVWGGRSSWYRNYIAELCLLCNFLNRLFRTTGFKKLRIEEFCYGESYPICPRKMYPFLDNSEDSCLFGPVCHYWLPHNFHKSCILRLPL